MHRRGIVAPFPIRTGTLIFPSKNAQTDPSSAVEGNDSRTMTPFVSSYACELHGSRNVKNHRSYNEETVKTLTRLSLFDHQNSLILPLGSSGSGVKVPFSKKFPLQLFRIESETSFDSLNFSLFEGGGIREVK